MNKNIFPLNILFSVAKFTLDIKVGKIAFIYKGAVFPARLFAGNFHFAHSKGTLSSKP